MTKTKVVKKAKAKKVPPRTLKSQAYKRLGLKIKPEVIQGVCAIVGCSADTTALRSLKCHKHARLIRQDQLRVNNKAWRAQAAAGKAGHRTVYGGRVTKWVRKQNKHAKKKAEARAGAN